MILAAIFCCTSIIGSIIIDAMMIGVLVIIELVAILLMFVPFAGTFLFRRTGIDGLAAGEYIDVYLADGWLHKIIAFVMINGFLSGLAGLIFTIPQSIRIVLGLSFILFMMTLSMKVDNCKNDYTEKQMLFSDFLPTILGFGIGCYSIFFFTAAPTVLGIIILCLCACVYMARNVLALMSW